MASNTTAGRRRRRDGHGSRSAPTPGSSPTTAATSCPAPASSAASPNAGSPRSATTRTRRSRRQTFVTIDGVRYSIPGDYAKVDADGTVKLLGRGSQCINTGGEKVYPEEVEEASSCTRPSPTPRVVGRPRRALRRGDHRARRAAPRRRGRRGGAHRPRQGAPRRLQGPQARVRHRHDRPGRQRQARLQAAAPPWPPSAPFPDDGTRHRPCPEGGPLTSSW